MNSGETGEQTIREGTCSSLQIQVTFGGPAEAHKIHTPRLLQAQWYVNEPAIMMVT